MTATTPTTKTEADLADLVADHAANVELYREITLLAASGYPAPLNEDQKSAYLLLPQLIDDCKTSFDLLPPELRPFHYLVAC